MSTSLAEQLQKLALPQTNQLQRDDRKRASLLFDPKEAADLSKETVFQIGKSGFDELKLKSNVFEQFQKTLFSISARDFERSVQTIEANEALNNNIKKYFLALSPYLMMAAAQKTLEWLIYRWKVHEYNTDDFIMLILPYHETNVFVKALQIIEIKKNDKWLWLKPLQKPGIQLAKSVLFNQAATNLGFLRMLSDHVINATKLHDNPEDLTIIFNMYCVTFVGALECAREVTDSLVTQMLPSIMKALKSGIDNFCSAAFIILSIIFTKTTLSDAALNKLVKRIVKVNANMAESETIMILTLLYQSHKEYKVMPLEALKVLALRKGFVGCVRELADANLKVDSILKPVLRTTIQWVLQEEVAEGWNFFDQLLQKLKFTDETVAFLLSSLLDSYDFDAKYSVVMKTWQSNVLQLLERQYPTVFDTQIKLIMNVKVADEDNNSSKQKKALQQIMQHINFNERLEVMEKLYHPSAEVRSAGIKKLITNFAILNDRDRDLVRHIIVDRLHEDDLEIVQQVIKFSDKFLGAKIVTDLEFKDVLLALIDKFKFRPLCSSIIEKLCKLDTGKDYAVFFAFFPYLLPITDEDFKCAKYLVKHYVPKSEMLIKLKTRLEIGNIVSLSNSIDSNLDKISIDSVKLTDALDKYDKFAKDAVYKYSALMLLTRTESSVGNLNLVPRLIAFIESSDLKQCADDSITNQFRIVRGGKLPLEGVYKCLYAFINNLEGPSLNLRDFYENTQSDQNYLKLLLFLLLESFHKKREYMTYFAKLFHLCLTRFAPTNRLEFLLNVACAENPNVQPAARLCLIRSVIASLHVEKYDLNKCFIVPFLLVCLQNEETMIRKFSMDLVEKLAAKKGSYSVILKAILSLKTEIISDANHLQIALIEPLSKPNQKSIFYMIASLVQTNIPIYVKAGIISAFAQLEDISIYVQFAELGSFILGLQEAKPIHAKIIDSIIKQFNETIAAQLKADSSILKFLILALKYDKILVENICPPILLTKRITKELCESLNLNVQKIILNEIVEVNAKTTNANIPSAVGKVFKHIDLDALTILPILESMRDILSPKLVESKRRRRISVIPTVDILDTMEWKKGVVLLELIQAKKKVRNIDKLITVLFGILKKCLDFDEQASVEYPKQLVLSSILHYCDKLEENQLPENVFNVELVVQCVRASPNPQTHHHALLLLAKISLFIPNQVLLHIMAIFTFMGSSVLRHDDAYSFQIISKIIETIVPILVQDNSRQKIINVLRVFADVILDVPEHRRLPLYTKLLDQIGIENLHLFLLLIFESHVMSTSKPTNNEIKRIDVACELCQQFKPKHVIHNCIQLTDYLKLLPEDNANLKTVHPDITFDVKQCTAKQFRHYKYTIVWFMSKVLNSAELMHNVATLDEGEQEHLEDYYKKLIVGILTYIQSTAKICEKYANTNQAKYWKVFLHHCYDILDSLNSLLTPEMFVLVVKGLTSHSLANVKRRALELLNTKLQQNADFFQELDQSDILALIPSIVSVIKKVESAEKLDSEDEIIVQTGLLSLKLLIRMLGSKEPDKFVPILTFVVDLLKTKVNPYILASTLLCLSELCTNLRTYSISSLNKFMPVILKVMKSQKKEEKPTLLLISAVTTLLKILDVLALFMSPYLDKLLCEYSQLLAKFQDIAESDPFMVKMKDIKEKIASAIPARILIPSIDNTYKILIAKEEFSGIGPLMLVLSQCLSNIQGQEVQQNMPDLTAFFLNALEFRCHHELILANQIEGHIIEAITKLILKLSEASFRPLYYKLYDWAIRCDEKSEKVITFYAFSSSIAFSLKGLFVLFAGHFLNNAATLLDACNNSKENEVQFYANEENNVLLLENVLKTLNFVFMHDYQKFINKDRFDVLMQPIVDQLDNTLGSDVQKRMHDLVIPTIVNFTVATGDDALWKIMNYQVMLKMRDPSPSVRLFALECLREVCKKVGEDFLPLLPETIPFLAELLEDEEETIEKACQKTIQELEGVLGESLQKYF